MIARIPFSACITLCSVLSFSPHEDTPLDLISAAETQYASSVARHKDELLTLLERKRVVAQQRGKLSDLQLIEQEIEQFDKHNKLPKSLSTEAYLRKMELARSKLVSEYESAIKDLTKSGDIEAAKSIQKTLDHIQVSKVLVPPDAVRKGRFAFKVFADRTTWDEAKAKCAQIGGRLASIDTKDNNDFLAKLAKDAKLPAIWLDITDGQKEGLWLHADGSELRFDNWDRARKQPNNAKGVEDHAVLITEDGRWWDYPNDPHAHPELVGKRLPGFVCQWVLDSRE